ncbi:MAG: hypothetical protein CMQ34_01355 [Gammaproteobacteria bacterium]|nr:hypothetical protein [Gammaproteobacteria bacterium]|tara:strand:- start:1734 stop:2600 length:867 start_codon:yes stop_codon:yes gene_type:complete
MVRRRRTKLVEDLIIVVSKFPWWLGLALAAVVYIFLSNYVARLNSTMDANVGLSTDFLETQLLHTLAQFGQYLLPAIFLMGAIASLINQVKRKSLFQNVVTSASGSELREMSWREFEMLVGELFRRRGYVVAENVGMGADGGVDLKLRNGSETFLVQCKHWRAYKVSVNIVRELYGVMASEGVTGGFVVTSGVFTSDAKAFAMHKNIELIDGPQLSHLLQETHLDSTTGMRQTVDELEETTFRAEVLLPSCPRCGGVMVRRTARRGQNAGREFWGCMGYPGCRGVVNV